MKIKRIKLVNFGSHELLESNTNDSTIVGIIGKNGQGKSTILKAIEFAFRGILPDRIDSWIRTGSDYAIVEVDFNIHGKDGEIVRRFGKSPRRYLKYDSEEVTRATDIDDKLEEIFDIDKRVLENAVFINQGEIHKLLFGSQAEREALFVRMLNLSFCDTIVSRIDTKSKALLHNVTDLSSQEVDIGEERKQALITKESLERDLRKLPDLSDTITNLNSYSKLLLRKDHFDKSKIETQTDLSNTITRTEEILKLYDGKTPEEVYNTKQEDVKHLREKYTKLIKIEDASKSFDRIKLEVDTLEKDLADAKSKYNDINDNNIKDKLQQEERFLEKYMERETKVKSYNELVREISELKKEYEYDEDSFKSLSLELENRINEYSSLIKSEEFDIAQFKKWYDAQSNITCLSEQCDSCGLKLASDQCISSEHLDSLRTRIVEKESIITAYKLAEEEVVNKYNDVVKDNHIFTTKLKRLSEESLRLATEMIDLPEGDVDSQKLKVQELREKVNELSLLSSRIAMLEDSYTRKKSELTSYESLLKDPLYSELDSLPQVVEDIKQLEESLEGILPNMKTFSNLAAMSETLKEKLEDLEKFLAEINEEENLLLQKIQEPVTALKKELNTEDDTLVTLEMEARQNRRNELIGELRAAERQYDSVTTRWRALQEKIKEQKVKLIIADDLDNLKGLFQKDGLPINYIRLMFERLVSRTHIILSDINSNYVIKLDEEREVSLLFLRTDKDESDWLPMSKMSGGERVRLTIAFLIALQELVLPELGLLILDEPSTHLDDEWVGAVRDLITSIGKYATNTDSQIWICDHNVQLIPAFDTTIQL